jgi:hypothetical protein
VRPKGRTNEELIRDLAELEYMAENKRLHAAVQASRLKSLSLPTGSPVPDFTVQSVEVEPFNADVDSAFPAVGEWKYVCVTFLRILEKSWSRSEKCMFFIILGGLDVTMTESISAEIDEHLRS